MQVRNIAKILVEKPFHALGFDIVRQRPSSEPDEPAAGDKRWEVPEENRFLWLAGLNINTIVDIGAHIGEFARMIHKILPNASIFSFEPLEAPFSELKNNMGRVPNFMAFKYALGDTTGIMEMHRNDFTPSSSLLPMTDRHKDIFPFTAAETIETVDGRRLDDVLKDLYFEDNILVKIDVQGYEHRVILGGEKLLSRAKLLIVETSFLPLYEGQPLFDDIYSMLRQRGFAYIGNWEQFISPADGSVLQADAMFIREERSSLRA